MSRKMQSQRRTDRKRAKQAKRRNTKRAKRNKCAKRNKEHLADAFQWLLSDDSIFAKIKLHGNTGWLPRSLVFLAILWAWSESRQLTDAYVHAVLCHRSMFHSATPATYQGFMGALARWTDTLITILALYKQRWGIEVEFRGLKQTLDRGKLRCRNDQRLLAELNWSIMAMAVAELFALKEQLAKRSEKSRTKKQVADPAKRSLANTMRALRGCMRNLEGVPEPGQELSALLANAVTDSYVRKRPKAARYRQSKPTRKPIGAPKFALFTS